MVQGKDHAAFLRILSRGGRNIHLASPEHHRCVSTQVLEDAAKSAGVAYTIHGSVKEAVTGALDRLAPGEICVVTGSFFTLEEACATLGIGPRRALLDPVEAVP